MGGKASKAKEETKQSMGSLLKVLEDRLIIMENNLSKKRGVDAAKDANEVGGGRTIMRMSASMVVTSDGPDQSLKEGVREFFNAAQAKVGSNNDQEAKQAALKGAEALITGGIDAIFGVTNGQSMEKQSFVVLYLNNAFVRVDYCVYSYSVSAKKYFESSNEAGCCYVCDLAVLDMADLNPSEIDYLVSQTLQIESGDFDKLMQMKVRMIEVAILSKALKDPSLKFEDLTKIVEQLGEAQKSIVDTFSKFPSIEPEGL